MKQGLTRIGLLVATAALLSSCANPEEIYARAMTLQKANSHAEALALLEELAADEHVPSQLALAKAYDFGHGTGKNPVKAAYWYRKAAINGNANAQDNLGSCYYHGAGVPKNLEAAATWHRRAADRGYPPAFNNLGLCYRNGEGVPQDEVMALRCFRQAAELGDAAGQYNLGRCYFHGVGVPANIDMARFWVDKSAAQGYENAILFKQDNQWK